MSAPNTATECMVSSNALGYHPGRSLHVGDPELGAHGREEAGELGDHFTVFGGGQAGEVLVRVADAQQGAQHFRRVVVGLVPQLGRFGA